MKIKHYSKQEIELIMSGKYDDDKLARITGRTKNSIQRKRSLENAKINGFTRQKVKWTPEKIQWIRDNADKRKWELAEHFGTTVDSINSIMLRYKIKAETEFRRLSDDDLEDIIKRYKAGEKRIDIAEMYDVSVATLQYHFSRLGLTNRKDRFSVEDMQEMKKMANSGDTQKFIAMIFGTTQTTVSRLVRM